MSKGAYVGINNVAHKIKKGYIGVDGVARKIKKAYIGIGGVARPCWGGGTLTYYGKLSNGLSVGRENLAATHIGNYALFGGGNYGGATVDAYNTSLTRTNPTGLNVGRENLAATHIGNYALFGGGDYGGSTVDAYDVSLTKTIPAKLSVGRTNLAATHVGNYALFGGGNNVSYKESTVDAYDTSLTRTIPTELSVSRYSLSATHVGKYALFGGGYNDSSDGESTVDAYDTSLTRTIPTELSVSRYDLAATHVGNYALFGGGHNWYFNSYGDQLYYYSTVDAYNTSLTRTNPTELSAERHNLAATCIGDYALFGGGYNIHKTTEDGTSEVVDAYDTSLTRTIPTDLYYGRTNLAATHVGSYALFGGGNDDSSSVYAYVLI